jgi:hypothetical protein
MPNFYLSCCLIFAFLQMEFAKLLHLFLLSFSTASTGIHQTFTFLQVQFLAFFRWNLPNFYLSSCFLLWGIHQTFNFLFSKFLHCFSWNLPNFYLPSSSVLHLFRWNSPNLYLSYFLFILLSFCIY